MSIVAVLGAFWGGEGKGVVSSAMASGAHAVVRFNGGFDVSPASIRRRDAGLSTSMIPEGMEFADYGWIGSGVILELESLMDEYARVTAAFPHTLGRLRISDKAYVSIPSKDRGDNPYGCFAECTDRDPLCRAAARKAYGAGLRVFQVINGCQPADIDSHFLRIAGAFREKLAEYCVDVEALAQTALRNGQLVIAQGHQGALMDLDYGNYPFVRPYATTVSSLNTGLGIRNEDISSAILVVPAFMTCPIGETLKSEMGQRESAMLKRRVFGDVCWDSCASLRYGWLDIELLRLTAQWNRTDELVITQMDLLAGFDRIFLHEGNEPVLSLPGWKTLPPSIRRFADLPQEARRFLDTIEGLSGIPVVAAALATPRPHLIAKESAGIHSEAAAMF